MVVWHDDNVGMDALAYPCCFAMCGLIVSVAQTSSLGQHARIAHERKIDLLLQETIQPLQQLIIVAWVAQSGMVKLVDRYVAVVSVSEHESKDASFFIRI